MSRVVVNKPQPLEPRFVEERDHLQVVFGARLRELRSAHNLTLEMLAERADLHANYVGAVERGERNLTLFNIWRIAGALGLPTTDLVNELPMRKVSRLGTT